MKRKFPQALESAALSLLCAWSAAGCLTTAFHLRVDAEYLMAGVWLAWTLLCTVLMLHRRGTVWLLVIAAVFFGWLWHHGSFGPQLLGTLGVMAKAYDAGYGFGVPEVLQVEPTAADWPLTVLAMFIIFAVSRTVCRRKGNLLPVVLLLGSLGACMVVTDTVPAAQSLFGLLLGVSLLLLTDSVRRENGGQAARLCGTAAIPVALALAVLFSCFPQASFVNTTQTLRENLFSTLMSLPQALQTQGMELLSGLKPREKVELSSLPTQLLLGIPVAEVTAQKTGPLYLRVQDYDVYTGTAWESSAGRQDTLAGSGEERGTVQLELLSKQENLLVPAFPDGQVFLREGKAENEDGAGTEYYRLREFSLAAYPGDQWLTLPEHTGMRARALIQAADISTENVEQTAENVAAFARECAVYDRTGTAMAPEADDFALWFLEQGDRGYCVHFATAAAVLLRSAGIPARYVTGYRVDAKAGEPVPVTSDDAHAWVEYYNYRTWGWHILEATPAGPEEPTLPEPTAQSAQPSTQPADPTAPTALAPTQPPQEASRPEKGRTLPLWLPLTVLSIALLALLAEGQRLVRIRLRQRREQRGNANQRAVASARHLETLARLTGRKVPDALQEMTEKALYSQHTLTEEELRTFALCQTAYRRKLRKAPWWRKLLYRYVYAAI